MKSIIKKKMKENKNKNKIFYPLWALLSIIGFYSLFFMELDKEALKATGLAFSFLSGVSLMLREKWDEQQIKDAVINQISQKTDYKYIGGDKLKKDDEIYNFNITPDFNVEISSSKRTIEEVFS